ncbi:head completion/stabilization protein [Diaphorobacter sp. HDW4A]|uniref:head completion/stabilization protein n=1 Tax=Diaphorobacter sp. HDW4A TaxID=2714924 RepID=UPI001407FDDA|nr:head completion/stabilization protein [Diaphorobacter sp. HDW4A]QIL80828.1 head completion/stabilization protein [Diaphorobacter sp. HDW4A]QIL83576.1 head completion/stabilization protein [Diaphorobacter sp. HDW4A]
MSFVAPHVNPPLKQEEGVVMNDGFFPDIDCERLRADSRIESTVTTPRMREAIEAAIWAINAELRDWRELQESQGYATLGDVPAATIGTGAERESVRLKQYRHAIKWHVLAETAEVARDMATLPQGAGKEARVTSGVEVRVSGFNQRLRFAIADLQSRSRVIAELI